MLKITGNIVTADLLTLKNLIVDAAKIVADDILEKRPFISKNEAYAQYGRRVVDKWISSGILKLHKDSGSNKIRISRMEIAAIASASNRVTV